MPTPAAPATTTDAPVIPSRGLLRMLRALHTPAIRMSTRHILLLCELVRRADETIEEIATSMRYTPRAVHLMIREIKLTGYMRAADRRGCRPVVTPLGWELIAALNTTAEKETAASS